jgi:heme/copper-type cytochrome/quinol oxidase subunit 1
MSLPTYYTPFLTRLLRFSLIMLGIGLLSGILYQESSKKAPFSAQLPPGLHWEVVHHLALVHGHTILVGTLIPLAMAGMLLIIHALGKSAVPEKSLRWGGWLFYPGAILSIALMLYKGYHVLLSVRFGQYDIAHIHHTLFMGQELVRQVVYGSAHTAMAAGLFVWGKGIWKALEKRDVLVRPKKAGPAPKKTRKLETPQKVKVVNRKKPKSPRK